MTTTRKASGFRSPTRIAIEQWIALGPRFLPFADAATPDLPLARLLRLSLFQISVGMVTVLLAGTLNRVMIVELGVPASLVAIMIALPILAAPFRALIGHRSDTHRSAFGWRRVPFVWYGSVAQWAGLAIMPFALLVMTDAPNAPAWVGPAAAALAFLLTGLGLHVAQTAVIALATDLAPEPSRPRVVALLYVMLLVGSGLAALFYGLALEDYTPLRMIQVIQGSAVVIFVLNMIALWKQEARRPRSSMQAEERRSFLEAWAMLRADRRTRRLLVAVFLGSAGFAMQDVLLEPYGGEILGLSVSATTTLTALTAGGALLGVALAARLLNRAMDPLRLAAIGALIGIAAFCCVIFAAPFGSPALFRVGAALIGFGGGTLAVGLLIAAMDLGKVADNGLAIGAWGAVQATAAGAGAALGGTMRDLVGSLAGSGALGEALASPVTGYAFVYLVELVLLFAALVAIGPLVRRHQVSRSHAPAFGFAELPG